MVKKQVISFLDIESIPLLIKDFLNKNIEGFENSVFDIENFRKKIEEKKSFGSSKRAVIAEVLKEQNSKLQLSENQEENLKYLAQENAFTVTTGHQLNLFTGPAFFIYKIIQTIKTASFLSKEFPEIKVVPVFWMASEDHDFEEIDHFKTAENYYEINAKSGGAVGKIVVEDGAFISDFEKEFKDSVFGTELILLLKKAYKKGNSLSEATRILVHHLFAEYGLLTVDGDDSRLKAEMKTIFSDELLKQQLYNTTLEKVEFLKNSYGKVQVNPREINLFYLSETRNRIEFNGENYSIVDTGLSFTKEEILQELENFPEKFSPNALMRPVYQENILPNLAYIGGNAEIMYWLELQDYFKTIKMPFPILIPRNSMLFLREKIFKKTEKLQLHITDFFQNFFAVINEKLLSESELKTVLTEKEALVSAIFSELKYKAEVTDKTFKNLVAAEETRQLKSFERMKKRLLRAEKIKHSEVLERIENLYSEIHPAKNWQERVYNFSVFYSEFGAEWLQTCYEEMEVGKSELIIMEV